MLLRAAAVSNQINLKRQNINIKLRSDPYLHPYPYQCQSENAPEMKDSACVCVLCGWGEEDYASKMVGKKKLRMDLKGREGINFRAICRRD